MFGIIAKHLPNVHCYPSDTKLYLAFSLDKAGDDVIPFEAMHSCIKNLSN